MAAIHPARQLRFNMLLMLARVAPYVIVCFLLLLRVTMHGQCLTGAETINQVNAIHASTAGDAEKISRLQALQQTFSKCHASKDSAYARIVHRLGDLYRESGNFEKGIAYTKEATQINRSKILGAERPYLTHSYYNLGIYYKLLYLLPESHQYFDSCIAIGFAFPEKKAIVLMALGQKAFSYYQAGDYQKSIHVSDQGMLLANSDQDTVIEATLLSQKAQAQIELGQIGAAEVNILKAIRTLEGADMPEYTATAYSIYARLLTEKKAFALAVTYYKKAFALNRGMQNWAQCLRDLMDLGLFYNHVLHNEKQALACYTESMAYATKANDAYQVAGLYNNMGDVYWKRKQYKQALYFFQKGLTTLPIQFNDATLGGNPSSEALKFVSNNYFVLTLLANKGETLIDIYKREKDVMLLQQALQAYEAADQTIDLMRRKQQGDESKFYWRAKTKKIYEKAIEACYRAGLPEKAYYFFEKSRAVLLNDQLNELDAKKFISPSDQAAEQALRLKVFSLNQQLAQQAENTAEYAVLKRELLHAQDDWEGFIKRLEKTYPDYYQYKYNNTVTPLQTLQAKLAQSGQTLVSYFNGDSVLYMLCVEGEKTTLLQLPYQQYKTVSNFLALCADGAALNRQYGVFKKMAFALHQQLVAPLHLATSRVIISPDDQFIPFEALLYDTTTNGAYLLKKHAFSYTYSAGLLMKKSNASEGALNFLGIAPVRYQDYLHQQPLLGADKSLQKIRSHFKEASLLTGSGATKQQFINHLPAFRIVQIYSHANADSLGSQPLLYLGDSALLLTQIQLQGGGHTELIVLSACRTGVGKNIRGEGIISLARGFAAAGIPATVTTLWQVDNKATYALTEAFYKYLSKGLPKDEAMQQAKLDLMQNSSMLNDLPYYWAGTILLGNAAKLIDTKPVSNTYQIYFLTAVLVSLLLLVIYRLRGQRQHSP